MMQAVERNTVRDAVTEAEKPYKGYTPRTAVTQRVRDQFDASFPLASYSLSFDGYANKQPAEGCVRVYPEQKSAEVKNGDGTIAYTLPPSPDHYSQRFCFPFEVPFGAGDDVVERTASVFALRALIVRTELVAALLTTPANWRGQRNGRSVDHVVRAEDAVHAVGELRKELAYDGLSDVGLRLVGSVAAVTSLRAKLGVASVGDDTFYLRSAGCTLVKKFAYPPNAAAVVWAPTPADIAKNKKAQPTVTLRFVADDRLFVETKADPDNNRDQGRIVEEYCVSMDPTYGRLILLGD